MISKPRQRGFFMLEIVLVLLFLSVLGAMLGMFGKPLLAIGMASNNTVAANLAQQAIESLKTEEAVFWRAIDRETELNLSGLSHKVETRQFVNKLEYTLHGTAQPHSILPNGIVVVTIDVSYTENGKIQSKPFVTYFTKNAF